MGWGTGHWDESEPPTPGSNLGDWGNTESEGKIVGGGKWQHDLRCITFDMIHSLSSVISIVIPQTFIERDSKMNKAESKLVIARST